MTSPVGEWIKARRKAKKLSLQKLAQKVGCSDTAIFRIERGERKALNLEIIRRIVEALEEPLGLFLQETGYLGEHERRFLEDPDFAKIYFELQRKKELSLEEKQQLADVLLRIIKSF